MNSFFEGSLRDGLSTASTEHIEQISEDLEPLCPGISKDVAGLLDRQHNPSRTAEAMLYMLLYNMLYPFTQSPQIAPKIVRQLDRLAQTPYVQTIAEVLDSPIGNVRCEVAHRYSACPEAEPNFTLAIEGEVACFDANSKKSPGIIIITSKDERGNDIPVGIQKSTKEPSALFFSPVVTGDLTIPSNVIMAPVQSRIRPYTVVGDRSAVAIPIEQYGGIPFAPLRPTTDLFGRSTASELAQIAYSGYPSLERGISGFSLKDIQRKVGNLAAQASMSYEHKRKIPKS